MNLIVCFSYVGHEQYHFDPNNLRIDLSRLLNFCLKRDKDFGLKTYIITDLSCDEKKLKRLLDEWERKNKEIGPKKFKLTPKFRPNTVVEMAKLVTNFYGTRFFDGIKIINNLLSTKPKQLFFYYSGHGINWNNQNTLMFPFKDDLFFLTKKDLRKLFEQLDDDSLSIVIFDACHSERMINLPISIKFNIFGKSEKDQISNKKYPPMIFIGSTKLNQTCGFLEEGGSLFTHYFINYICEWDRFDGLWEEVEDKIIKYRRKRGLKDQNMILKTNRENKKFPEWFLIAK